MRPYWQCVRIGHASPGGYPPQNKSRLRCDQHPKRQAVKLLHTAFYRPQYNLYGGKKQMKTEKTINLTAYTVEYIDQREPKPRTVHAQTVVLDHPAV